MNTVLHVLCGLPGSGKSTLAPRLAASTPGSVVVLSADAVRTEHATPAKVFAWLHQAAEKALAAHCSVVTDTCALRKYERARLLAVGRRAGAECVLTILTTPWQVCIERDRARSLHSTVQWPPALELIRAAVSSAPREGWDVVQHMDQRGALVGAWT
jgi:predicted kinase